MTDANKNIFPDNDYGDIASWNGEIDGVPATFGVIKPGTDLSFEVDPRGEHIVLYEPSEKTKLRVDIVGESDESLLMTELDTNCPDIELPPGLTIRVRTDANSPEVTYLCLYEYKED